MNSHWYFNWIQFYRWTDDDDDDVDVFTAQPDIYTQTNTFINYVKPLCIYALWV